MKLHKKHRKPLSIIGIVAALLISVWGLYVGISQWNPPDYFPLNDPQGEYTIVKTDAFYSLTYSTKSNNIKTTYCDVNIIGLKTNCRTEPTKDFTIYIANSPVSLEQLINERVNVTGSFTYTNKQCIQKVCTPLGEYAGLNIKTIKKK